MTVSAVQALIDKAKESAEVARSLPKDGHYDFAASRGYYAMFYVAEALLAHLGQALCGHIGIRSRVREGGQAGGEISPAVD